MSIKMAKKLRRDRGIYFTDLIRTAQTDKKELLDRLHKIRMMYYKEPGGYSATEPWDGAADIHLPIIMEKVETAVPKIVSALWRANPFVNVRSPGGGQADMVTKNVEKFANWAFRNDIPNMYLTLENFVRNMLIDGTAIGKVRWKRRVRRAIDTHVLKRYYRPGDTLPATGEEVSDIIEKTDSDILAEIFGLEDIDHSIVDWKLLGKGRYSVKFTEDGRVYKGEALVEPNDVIDEVVVRVFRDIIEQDSPEFDLVDIEDFAIPFRAKSIEDAAWVAQKTWYTLEEIDERVSSGDWNLSKAELATLKGSRRRGDEDSQTEYDRDTVTGETTAPGYGSTSTDGKFDTNRVPIWEVYCRDYADGGTEPINVIYFIPDDLQLVIGSEYHDDVFPHGQRPFVSASYVPVPNRFLGIGMAELLYAINLEVDDTISKVHNMTEIVVNPVMLYTPYGMSGNDKLLKGIKPGTWVPTTDVTSVRSLNYEQQPLSLMHASFNTLIGYGDRMTFSPAVGGDSNYRNAPRTARGTLALMNQAEEKLSSIVEQMQATAWKQLVTQVVSMYGRYVSIDKWFYVTGETKARRINPKDLRSNYMFEFSGSLTSVNREVQRMLAEKRFLALRMDPSYNTDPQARQYLVRDYMQHMSEGQDVEHMLPALPGQGGFTHPPMDQDDETMIMAKHVSIDVLPTDDHKEHIGSIKEFMKSEVFETLSPIATTLIGVHLQSHMSANEQQIMMQQRIAEVQGGAAPGQQTPLTAPQPGAPTGESPAYGGELSATEGGPV